MRINIAYTTPIPSSSFKRKLPLIFHTLITLKGIFTNAFFKILSAKIVAPLVRFISLNHFFQVFLYSLNRQSVFWKEHSMQTI